MWKIKQLIYSKKIMAEIMRNVICLLFLQYVFAADIISKESQKDLMTQYHAPMSPTGMWTWLTRGCWFISHLPFLFICFPLLVYDFSKQASTHIFVNFSCEYIAKIYVDSYDVKCIELVNEIRWNEITWNSYIKLWVTVVDISDNQGQLKHSCGRH